MNLAQMTLDQLRDQAQRDIELANQRGIIALGHVIGCAAAGDWLGVRVWTHRVAEAGWQRLVIRDAVERYESLVD